MIYNDRIHKLISLDQISFDEIDGIIKRFTSYGSLTGENKDIAFGAVMDMNKLCEKFHLDPVYVDDGTDLGQDLTNCLIQNLKRDKYGEKL